MLVVIGYGNPLRMDDGLGQVVIDHLQTMDISSPVELLACHQLLPEHAEAIGQAERVIFIDAAAGQPPGEIVLSQITAVSEDSAGLVHDFTPQTLLAYAELLYGRSPTATLITVNGFCFDYGDALSKEMSAVLPELIEKAMHIINKKT